MFIINKYVRMYGIDFLGGKNWYILIYRLVYKFCIYVFEMYD